MVDGTSWSMEPPTNPFLRSLNHFPHLMLTLLPRSRPGNTFRWHGENISAVAMSSTSGSSSSSGTSTLTTTGHCIPTTPSTTCPSSPVLATSTPVEVAIIGGGAAGLAVSVQLIQRIRAGHTIKSITIIEKAPTVGPGLAYSKACSSTIVNMHSDRMGLCPINPMEFSQWVKELSPKVQKIPFPSREQYGLYLKDLMHNVLQQAKELDVDFKIVNDEGVDLARKDGFLEISCADGQKVHAKDVVLALGNFCATLHKELRGNPNYFRCPWPVEKLKGISPDAPVFIMGSRLTAIDAANALVEIGHHGKIMFISRSGRLPKVQAKSSRQFQRLWAIHCLARELEAGSEGGLSKLVAQFKKEIEKEGTTDFSGLTCVFDPLATLKADIENAENSALPWQPVLYATSALVERYWNCFTDEEKKYFDQCYNNPWYVHRHSIPLANARRVLNLLESGQLQVLRGSKVQWDGSKSEFVFQTGDTEHRAAALIETLGQEFDTSKIQSPLLEQLLSRGLLDPHPVGGVCADFNTLKAGDGIHVIGSLTRGVHFYTTSIDRIATHASRIADSLTGLQFRRPLHIAFFVGSDIFSHLMLSKLVPKLLALGHVPFIFQPSDSANSKKSSSRPFALRELAFWERTLYQKHIIPFLGTSNQHEAACMTVEQMKAVYGLMVEKMLSINSHGFLQTLKNSYVDIGVSLRCYQRFGPRITEYFSTPSRALLNLHPGILLQYRGAITAIRSMMADDADFGYSLHHIDKDSDAGAVIDIRKSSFDYKKTVLGNMEEFYATGVGMVADAIEKFARSGDFQEGKIEQDAEKSGYFSFLTEEDLATCNEKGIRLVDGEKTKEFLVSCFAGKGKEDELRWVIGKAAETWYEDSLCKTAKM